MGEKISFPVAVNSAEYLNWYLTLPSKMLLQSEKDCMYYLYQMHAAIEVLQAAGSSKAKEMMVMLDTFNKAIQARLYGAAGINTPAEEEETVEVDS